MKKTTVKYQEKGSNNMEITNKGNSDYTLEQSLNRTEAYLKFYQHGTYK